MISSIFFKMPPLVRSGIRHPRRSLPTITATSVLLALGQLHAADAPEAAAVDKFNDALKELVQQAEAEEKNVVEGHDGWLFFVPELRSLAAGKFWGESAKDVTRAANPKYADPMPAIVDFHEQLNKAGIELLVVPIPPKAAVYPEMLPLPSLLDTERLRLDTHYKEFYGALESAGVPVVDILPLLSNPREPEARLYCKTDTHWSGTASLLTAQLLFDQVEDRPWLKEVATRDYATQRREITITGDLARMLNESNPLSESLSLPFVGTQQNNRLIPIDPDRQSPVLLMGDSHTLVFHDPALHAKGAGLPDHLALQFGFPLDLVGIRGSASAATRVSLARRRDNLAGKKLVIWCFSVRELTESYSGWPKIPVIRD